MSFRLDSRLLHGRGQGGSRERLPQGRWMYTLTGEKAEEERRSRRRGDEDIGADQKKLV